MEYASKVQAYGKRKYKSAGVPYTRTETGTGRAILTQICKLWGIVHIRDYELGLHATVPQTAKFQRRKDELQATCHWIMRLIMPCGSPIMRKMHAHNHIIPRSLVDGVEAIKHIINFLSLSHSRRGSMRRCCVTTTDCSCPETNGWVSDCVLPRRRSRRIDHGYGYEP